jgi:hypothetical protein
MFWTSKIDPQSRFNLRNDPKAVLRGQFHGNLRKELDELLRKEQLTAADERRIELIENTLRK